ncbi:hypothetical protein [Bradyrhizobium sp. OAE829]|uniref:Ig-like domain-containing protein n=1 Tax=Bradyrhizobium sp. OAE829 TaxID=2663807 RepID=UPI003398F0FB
MPNKLPKANKVSVFGFEDQRITVALSGSDADGSISSYSLTSLPSNGVLYLDASLTQVASLNVAYGTSTFYFLPSANSSGTANFSYTVKDNQGGVSVPAVASLTVSSVNDAPILDLNGSAAGSSAIANYSVNGPATLIAPAAIVTDVDSTNFGGGSLKIAVAQAASTDKLSIATDATVSVSNGNIFVGGVKVGTILAGQTGSNGSDLTINFSNSATPSAVSTLLDHVAYSNSSANPTSFTRTVQFTVVDGDGKANGGADASVTTATINILAPNHAPTGSVTVSGTPTEDQTLTASNTLADADGIGSITYHWLRGGVDTGATGSTYVLGDADVGAQISVRATYTDARGASEAVNSAATTAVSNVNDAPTGSVTISGTPTEDQTLTASNTLADADGIGSITYHWLRGGVDTGATGSTYVLGDADVGAQISVRATYTDARGASEAVNSAATTAVSNVNDAPTGSVTISGTPTEDQTLTASNTLADADGIGSITYHWLRGGVDTGATGSTYVLGDADVGAQISVRANYTDARGTAEAVTSAATAAVGNGNDAPTGSVTISGTATEDQTLTASNTLNDADGLGAITYHWQRDGVDTGATGSTYLLGDADVGAQISVVASFTDGQGAAEAVTSAATAAVANINDAPSGSVTISGTATEDQTLTASNTLADADGVGAITYHWLRGGVDTGVTGTSYLLGNADVGAQISVWANYTDLRGTAEVVTSAETATVANVNDLPTGSVTISGMPTEDATPTASSTLADADGIGAITYHWLRGGVDTGATGTTYVLGDADVGAQISVRATYTDARGAAEAVTSAATTAVANVNDAPTGAVTLSGPFEGNIIEINGWFTQQYQATEGADYFVFDVNHLDSAQPDGAQIFGFDPTMDYIVLENFDEPQGERSPYNNGFSTGTVVSDGHYLTVYPWSNGDEVFIDAAEGPDQYSSPRIWSVGVSAETFYDNNLIITSGEFTPGTVTISGTPTEDQVLTASNTLADADGIGSITYHWLRGGVDTGATGSTYVLGDADVGAQISVRATYTDARGAAEAVTSTATATVANVNDAPSGSVTISGTPTEDQTLTAANTLADADGFGPITYHWLRGGVDTGATGATYVLGDADVGSQISVRATYTDARGASEAVNSAATTAVSNVNDAPTGSVTISGTPTEDQTLTAANTLADADGLGAVSYQWLRDGSNIVGAVGVDYEVLDVDVGHTISVVASYVDGKGTHEAISSQSTNVVVSQYNENVFLTTGVDLQFPSELNTKVIGTASTLNSSDQIDGGAGFDVLTLYGAGTYHLDTVSQLNGFEQVNFKNLGNSSSQIYLRDGEDISVTIGSLGEFAYQANVYLGTNADTTVNAAASIYSATFVFSTGDATIHDFGNGFSYYNLSSGTATVYASTSTDPYSWLENYYNFSSGTYALHGSAYGNDHFTLTDPSQLQTASSIDGGSSPEGFGFDTVSFSGNFNYDLTTSHSTTFANIENYNISSGASLKVASASLAGIANIDGDGVLTTDAATFDLSNITVSSKVTSQNLAGTTFTVTDPGTAAHIVGGSGQDTVIGQGFIFTEDQRNAVFLQGSVETLVDSSGTYISPNKLTAATDAFVGSSGNDAVIGTSSTLNSSDQIDGGAGFDVLTLYGAGTYHLDTVSQLNGFEQVNFKNLGNSSSQIYLRDGEDISVTIGSLGEFVYQANVYLGTNADTTVNAAASIYSATFVFSTGDATIHDFGNGFSYYNLSSGTATVYASTSTDPYSWLENYYNFSSGTYALHGSAYGNDHFTLTDPSQLQTASSLDGGSSPEGFGFDTVSFSGNFNYDLTTSHSTTFANIENYNISSGASLKVASASLAGIANIDGDGVLTTDAATFDLSNITVSSKVTSQNLAGTTFTVTDPGTAAHIVGGSGQDTVIGQGFIFTEDQRNAVFLQGSVETLVDSSGTYISPNKLTAATDAFVGSSGNDAVIGTSSTLNSSDQIDGGAGFDVLTLYGAGTYHLDTVSQLNGFEQVNFKNLGNSSSQIYLRDGEDISVTIGSLGEFVYQANVYLGTNADTTVNAAASIYSATFVFSTGDATIHDFGNGFSYYNLSSGTATVYASTSTDPYSWLENYYNFSSGTYALHGSAYGNDHFTLTDPSQLQTASSLDGGSSPEGFGFDTVSFSGNFNYDLTTSHSTTFANIENYNISSGASLKVASASLAGIANIDGDGVLTTDAATFDLSNITVSSKVTSQNLAGTTFTVTDPGTAAHIVGGSGQDTVIGQGFIFTEDQRNAVFLQGSVDVIKDAISVHGNAGDNTLVGFAGASLTGGGGGDTFVFNTNSQHQTITDLNLDVDNIVFQALFDDVEAVLDATHDDGLGNAYISDGDQNTITLLGVNKAQLIAAQDHLHIMI